MESYLAPRLARVRPSPTAEISEKLRSLTASGRSVINLGEGELDFDTPVHIKEAAIDAIRKGDTKYTAVAGTRDLKAAIIEKFRSDNGLIYDPHELIAGCGAKQLIFNALLATVSEGDEVIIPSPYWVSYPDMVSISDGVARVVACEEAAGWKLSPEALAAAITPRTRWLILNSPSNPTGAIYTSGELAALGDVLYRHEHVLILADDIYEHVRYSGPFATMAEVNPGLRNRVLTVNGVSKAYSMTGWRLGYAAGPAWLISAMETLQSQSTSNPSSISQAAAVCALRSGVAFMTDWLAELRIRRDYVVLALNQAEGLRCVAPEGAFYVFVNCAGVMGKRTPDKGRILNDFDLAAYFLESVGVGTVHGGAFGASPYLRIAFGVDRPLLVEACRRLVEACRALR